MVPTAHALEAQADSPRPFFVPSGVNFDELPEELRAAIIGIVNPAYRQLVLEARDGLEKSVGVTVVHLLWLEIIDQLDLAQSLGKDPHPEVSEERGKRIERHLRVVGAKSKTSHFLLRLKEFHRKWAVDLAPLGNMPETIEPPGGWPAADQIGG